MTKGEKQELKSPNLRPWVRTGKRFLRTRHPFI